MQMLGKQKQLEMAIAVIKSDKKHEGCEHDRNAGFTGHHHHHHRHRSTSSLS